MLMLKRIFGQLRQRWYWLVLLLILTGGGYWYYGSTQTKVEEFEYVAPTVGELIESLEVSGIVDASQKARLRFLMGGKLVYVGVSLGDSVTAGQTIASIDRQALEKELSQDLNRYMQERWTYERTYDNFENRILTDDDRRSLDTAQRNLDNRVIDVEIRSLAIADSRLSAPFAGVLTVSPTTSVGVQLSANDYFELINPKTLQIVTQVDEIDIAKLQIGQKATVRLDAYPDEQIETQVSFIAFVSTQSASGTVFRVELPLDETNIHRFRLGMNADVTIELDKKDQAVYVPFEAVSFDPDTSQAYVQIKGANGLPERVDVTIGLETDEFVEIISGIDASQAVAIRR